MGQNSKKDVTLKSLEVLSEIEHKGLAQLCVMVPYSAGFFWDMLVLEDEGGREYWLKMRGKKYAGPYTEKDFRAFLHGLGVAEDAAERNALLVYMLTSPD